MIFPTEGVARRALRESKRMISDLQKMIRQPSVSATGEGLDQCARLVCEMLQEAGLDAALVHPRSSKGRAGSAAPPVVYAERRSKSGPGRTLLFYNHYDVQPAEPLEQWHYPAFGGVQKGNRIYGRGAIDDKGEIAARLHAVRSWIRETGDVPCNVKFLIEGEEETGSCNLGRYLSDNRKRFACDGVIWEFGYVNPDGRPVIGLGMKGLMFVELCARGPVRDAHSSLAVLVENPAWRLVGALYTMRSADGRITIPGWYDGVRRSLTRRDLRLVEDEPFDEEAFKKEFKIERFVGGQSGLGARKALAFMPTCNIAGFSSGYEGSGAKTVLPATATAKLDFRLVPGMVPERLFGLLCSHLESRGFSDVQARLLHAESAARTDPSEKLVKDVRRAASVSFGAEPVMSASNPATGPMHAFYAELGAPCVSVGGTYVYSRIHSPDEFARIDLLKKTAACMCHTLSNFAGT